MTTITTGTTYQAVNGHTYVKSANGYSNSRHSNECPCHIASEINETAHQAAKLKRYIKRQTEQAQQWKDLADKLPQHANGLMEVYRKEAAEAQEAAELLAECEAELAEYTDEINNNPEFAETVRYGEALLFGC